MTGQKFKAAGGTTHSGLCIFPDLLLRQDDHKAMDSPKTAEYRHSDSDAEVGQLMASKEVEPSPEVAENTGDHQAEADDRDMDEEEDGAGLFGSGSENEHSEGDGYV